MHTSWDRVEDYTEVAEDRTEGMWDCSGVQLLSIIQHSSDVCCFRLIAQFLSPVNEIDDPEGTYNRESFRKSRSYRILTCPLDTVRKKADQ